MDNPVDCDRNCEAEFICGSFSNNLLIFFFIEYLLCADKDLKDTWP